MHSATPLSDPAPFHSQSIGRKSSSPAGIDKNVSQQAAPRPFVERRRRRPGANQSWQDAMDSLQQHIQGFEAANGQWKETAEHFKSIFDDAPIGMFEIDAAGHALAFNRAMAQIFGYESLELILAEFVDKEAPVLIDPSQWADWINSPEVSDTKCGVEVNILCPNGDIKCVRLNLRAIREEGEVVRFEGTGEDITERKRIEVRNQLLAYYDRVTGLPNATLFQERLDEAVASAVRTKTEGALLLIRIERFKVINDSLGALFGDRLLKEIAQRIKTGVGEACVVARVGGAEFAVILPEVRNAWHVRTTAENVRARLSEDFTFLGHSLTVLQHIGISTFPEHGTDGDTLMQRADVAMRSAQEEGSNNIRFFTSEMNSEMMDRMRMESGLRLALTRSELFLVYQPQVDSRTGALTGLEALIRWQHPQLGLIPPGEFIGLAENTGLIVPIGEWVLRTACAQARKWQDEGLVHVPVAVNVSALQFRQQGFRDLVRNVLAETGLNPRYLELELTESLLLTNADVMFSALQDFKKMGVMLAIDDFGTGYSSLSYLRQFKVNRLKISRSFVQDVSTNSDDAAITTAIIKMAKALNLSVLAEGVENEEQLDFLRGQDCFTIQGFYFSRPVKDEQLLQHLRTGFVSPSPVK